MQPRLEWSRSAYDDLLAIVEYIAKDSPAAAQDLLDEIQEKVGALPERPTLYALSKRAPGYRQLTVRTNYLVFYRLLPDEAAPAVIRVVAVVHARRQWP